MEIVVAKNKESWNNFVKAHYPPVGAFMQTWEWGEFQAALGRKTERYEVREKDDVCAVFTLVHHALPLGLSYGYVPRGPVVSSSAIKEGKHIAILTAIKTWAKKTFPKFTFLRLEPHFDSIPSGLVSNGFRIPAYYIQPRFNSVVEIKDSDEEILAGFHPSTRSNIRRAENRGVTVEVKNRITQEEYRHFSEMAKDTIKRNSGKNAYPDHKYFEALFKRIPSLISSRPTADLSMSAFYGYQDGVPAGAHFVLFFGDTATYLYGASYSDKLRSKVTTYLHWAGMQEARRRKMSYYDLGGVDEVKWPTLTTFKRQFRGKEFAYMGNLDISLRPVWHRIYETLRALKKREI